MKTEGINKYTSVLKYPGAKWRMAEWIISLFPKHHSYLEAFFGSGAVLFRKPCSNIETVNDMDGEIVNFFECIRSDPMRLAHEIYFTPYARQIYEDAYVRKPQNNYERARNFFIRCNMGHGYRTTGEKVGWKNDVRARERAYAATTWSKLPDSIIEAAKRLKGVQIDNRPAQELIPKFNYDNVLIYADPPYMLETRHGKQYRYEMSNKDHEDLLEVLKVHKGPVLISGYQTELYHDMLHGWHKEIKTAYSQVASKKEEVVWMNFVPQEQISLFGNEV